MIFFSEYNSLINIICCKRDIFFHITFSSLFFTFLILLFFLFIYLRITILPFRPFCNRIIYFSCFSRVVCLSPDGRYKVDFATLISNVLFSDDSPNSFLTSDFLLASVSRMSCYYPQKSHFRNFPVAEIFSLR